MEDPQQDALRQPGSTPDKASVTGALRAGGWGEVHQQQVLNGRDPEHLVVVEAKTRCTAMIHQGDADKNDGRAPARPARPRAASRRTDTNVQGARASSMARDTRLRCLSAHA